MANYTVFDGHNDTVLRLKLGKEKNQSFFDRENICHINFQRAKKGHFGGGFFAAFTPTPDYSINPADHVTEGGYDIPLPPPVSHERALRTTHALAAELFEIEEKARGDFKVVRDAKELARCIHNGTMAAIFHIEGAEAIDTDLDSLTVLYQAGLRSLGVTWSRPNDFGEGVPFRYPSTPDIGEGLTEAGFRLVKACNELGIMVDTTHLNEKGFWDVAKMTDAPLVATHSNVHALCEISRNLTDQQLAAIAESNGVAGLNYAVNMLRSDGQPNPDTPLDEIVKHAAYIAEKFGVDHVALGSDFDGTTIPNELGDVSGLPKLIDCFEKHGFSEEEIHKITHKNWLRVLGDTWK